MNDVLGLMLVADLEPPIAFETRARRSTAEVVGELYDRWHGELFSVTLRSCRDREAAEDIVQEAYTRLIAELDAGRMPDNARAWLHRVAANLVVSRSRKSTVARKWQGVFAIRESAAEPEHRLLDFEQRSDLAAVLGELPVESRTALLLAAQGFSGAEIAQAIGRSENATRTLMCRARLRLRERLEAMEARA